MYSFSIQGNTPSKKNSKRIVFAKGRRLIISSKRHKEWHANALPQATQCPLSGQKLTEVSSIILTFFATDNRKFDLTNRAESIMDLLVDAEILNDDNWSVVPEITLRFGGVEKGNPRCDIEIL